MPTEELRGLITIFGVLIGAMAAVLAPVLAYFIGMRKARADEAAAIDARIDRYVKILENRIDTLGKRVEKLESIIESKDDQLHETDRLLRESQGREAGKE